MQETQEFLTQQERQQAFSLVPIEIAGLLAILMAVERYSDGQTGQAAAYLLGLFQADSTVDVHLDGFQACIDELVKYSQRG